MVRRNLAFANLIGFYANYHPGGLDFFNNTAFDNPANYDMRPAPGVATTHKLRNNLAAGTGEVIVNFTGGGSDDFNSWSLPVDVSSADFASMDKTIGTMPRDADGNLPSDAHASGAGQRSDRSRRRRRLPFVGSAPDLGAYEFGENATGEPADAGGAAIDHDAGVTMMPGSGGAPAMPSGSGGSASKPLGTGGAAVPSGAGGAQSSAIGSGGSSAPPPAATGMTGASGEGDRAGTSQSAGCGCRVSTTRGSMHRGLVLLAALWLVARKRRNRWFLTRDASAASRGSHGS